MQVFYNLLSFCWRDERNFVDMLSLNMIVGNWGIYFVTLVFKECLDMRALGSDLI